MKVTQEKLPASQVGLEIEITPEMSKKVYEKVVQDFTRSTNIPGFRKGKVPRQVLIQRIGASRVKAAAVEELVEDGLKEAVKQENIEALGNYQLRSSFEELVSQFEPGQSLTFSASVDVQPEVTLNQYTGFQLQAEEIKSDPEQVDKVLQGYQDQLATLVPVEGRPAQVKDIAVIDFKGVLPSDDPDQEPVDVPGGEAQDFQLELLEGRFIEGFVDGIIGMNPGETKEIEAQFPETYAEPSVAGRRALFSVVLNELKEKDPPELDDDFAKEVSEFETLAELRESLESRFSKEADDKTRSNQEQAILDELVNHIEVEIPETLIEREVNQNLQQTALQLQNQGVDVRQLFTQELVARLREQARPDAVKRLKRTLALGEVGKREAIAASEEEITARVAEVLESLGEQRQEIDPDRLTEVIAEDVLKEKILDWLIEHSTIELVPEGTLSPETDTTVEVESATGGTSTIDVTAETVAETLPEVAEDSPTTEVGTEPVAEPTPTAESVETTSEAPTDADSPQAEPETPASKTQQQPADAE